MRYPHEMLVGKHCDESFSGNEFSRSRRGIVSHHNASPTGATIIE